MIYTQQAQLPIIFQVDEGIILDVQHYLQRNNLNFPNVLLVSGQSFSHQIACDVALKYDWGHYVLEDNTFQQVEELKGYTNANKIDLLIAIGGGKVIDTVKRVSYLSNTNNLSIPTIISNDGLISPIAVIKNDSGKTDSLPGMMPMGVIIDIDIIKESPERYIQAAIGDVFSNISATNDWVLAFKQDKERINDIAFHLAKGAANSLINFNIQGIKSKMFLRMLVQGLVNSGIAMSLAGSSRPCSGSEHLISHSIDFLGHSNGALHGLQVGSVNLFTLYLQGKLKKVHIDFAQSVGIPLDFTSILKKLSNNELIELFETAIVMRPGRYTILNEFTSKELLVKLIEFRDYIKGK